MTKKLLHETNRIAVAVEKLNQKMVEMIDLAQRRLDVHSDDIYFLSERLKALEDYLGVELKGKPVIKKKYIKRK